MKPTLPAGSLETLFVDVIDSKVSSDVAERLFHNFMAQGMDPLRVVDDAGERYTLYTLSGVPREAFSKFPMPRNTAIFEPTFSGTGIVVSDDITKDPRYGRSAPHHGEKLP